MQSTGQTSTQAWSTQSLHSREITHAIFESPCASMRPIACARLRAAGSHPPRAGALLEFGFLVRHVLAHDRIVLLDLELARGVLAVLDGRVEVAGPRRRLELDLLALALLGHPEVPPGSVPAALPARASRLASGGL